MDGVIENVYVSDGHDSINSHTLYQQNVWKPLIISNNGDDIEINDGLKNFYLSRLTGLINSHNLY